MLPNSLHVNIVHCVCEGLLFFDCVARVLVIEHDFFGSGGVFSGKQTRLAVKSLINEGFNGKHI